MGYKNLSNISQDKIKELFKYDENTGVFIRIHKTNLSPSNYKIPRNTKNNYTYFRVLLDKSVKIPTHLLAWIYVYGRYPIHKLIHINGDKSDNRINNLKELSAYNYAIYKHNLTEKVTAYKIKDNNKLVSNINNDITYEELIEFFTYKDGNLIRIKCKKKNDNHRLNKIAGTKSKSDGYIYIRVKANTIKSKRYLAHRLIWLYHNKKYPKNLIDHIDGDRSNNKIENLREATSQQNSMNRKVRNDSNTGIKGVFYSKEKNSYCSAIMVNEKRIHLGTFKTIEEARDVYNTASNINYAEFSNV